MKRYRRRYYRRGYYYYSRRRNLIDGLASLIAAMIILTPILMIWSATKWIVSGVFNLIVATITFFIAHPSVFAVVVLLIIYFVYIELKDDHKKVKYVSPEEVERKKNDDFYKNNGIF